MYQEIEKVFIVTDNFSGQRLDLYLSQQITKISRSKLKQAIQSDKVKVDEEVQFHPQYRVKSGDKVKILIDYQLPDNEITPVYMPLDIVAETDDYLVINKPSGLVVHPGSGHENDTLANGIKYYLTQKGEDVLGLERAGLIHRLDKGTSGIIIVAKSPKALWYISNQFADRKVSKSYLCLVKGNFNELLQVTNEIGRDRYNRQKFSSNTNAGKLADTKFYPLAQSLKAEISLVLAKPKTGRTHQIRVHIQELGFPIIGDRKYGKSTLKMFIGSQTRRLLLHAYQLKLSVAESSINTEFSAYPDSSFWQICKQYQLKIPSNEQLLSKLQSLRDL